ncbi:MAG: SGNH/GDSL hydrolase family protein [Acidobacteria bacterium]|nr:SGNH/GDSL hydrolase family protein [Acidobacteriota bacterium]
MDIQIFQYHPLIGFHFIPDLQTRIQHESGGYLLRTNNAGFRSERDFVLEKNPDTFRILLFGDSFTAGDGVGNKYRFGDVLESLIPGVEVYNFGLPGTGTDQQYLVYREIAAKFEHDLVVIAVQVENIRRVASRFRMSQLASGEKALLAKPYFEFDESGALSLKGVPVQNTPIRPEELTEDEQGYVDQGGRLLWLRQAINKVGGQVKEVVQRVSKYQPLPEYDDPKGNEWTLMKAILKKWIDECEKPVIVMPVPLYHYVEQTASADSYRARFAELADIDGVTLHDPLSDCLSVSKAERRAFRFETDIHPTPSHHRLLAESLSRPVRKKLEDLSGE